MTDRPLNATAASLLGFLHEGPLTGWDLVQTAQRRIGNFWSLTQSQVYRELGTMADGGLVAAGERGARDRRPYEITDAGRAAFAEWLTRVPSDENIRFPLLLAISFGQRMAPADLHRIVRHHRRLHADRLAGYRHNLETIRRHVPDPDPYQLATLTFGIAHEEAAVGWFDGLPVAIRGEAPWDDDVPGGEAS
ncbi:MAG: Transcriptional regulator, PadR family [uncultured Thermomicrobiales bacterium]|uniref:Transcriptional regulator, PadR family n=1 Tax=uncultured Thermomicrobiales bacterium TaxID=1645740 RepID=A0A6J4UZE0_9BACT|nr:MAG: Transcriptional regulator, PadR family [uncultured Thermomicrobiales bacterium]